MLLPDPQLQPRPPHPPKAPPDAPPLPSPHPPSPTPHLRSRSNGWQVAAADSFDAGAAPALADVLTRHSRDSEIQLLSLTQLQAIALVGLSGSVVSSGALGAVARALSD
jgi:hypothetical protein